MSMAQVHPMVTQHKHSVHSRRPSIGAAHSVFLTRNPHACDDFSIAVRKYRLCRKGPVLARLGRDIAYTTHSGLQPPMSPVMMPPKSNPEANMLAWSQSKTNTDYKQALQDAMPSAPVRTDKYRDAIIRLSQDVAPTRTTPWRSYMKALFSAVAQSDEAVVIVVYLSGGDAVTGTFSLNCPLSSTLPRTFWVHDLESDTRFELDLDGVIHYAVLANGMNTV